MFHRLVAGALFIFGSVGVKAIDLYKAADHFSICRLEIEYEGKSATCSGVLIDSKIVVTAAHCLHDRQTEKNPKSVSVKCGLIEQSLAGGNFKFKEEFKAKESRTLPDWNAEPGLDFGLVWLDREAKNIKPMRLPLDLGEFRNEFMKKSATSINDFEFNSNIDCKMAGFGFDQSLNKSFFAESDRSPRNGLKGFQSASDDQTTTLVIHYWSDQISALRRGDSGGPLFCRSYEAGPWTLVGVVSSRVVSGKNKDPVGTDFFVPVATTRFLDFFKKFKSTLK